MTRASVFLFIRPDRLIVTYSLKNKSVEDILTRWETRMVAKVLNRNQFVGHHCFVSPSKANFLSKLKKYHFLVLHLLSYREN